MYFKMIVFDRKGRIFIINSYKYICFVFFHSRVMDIAINFPEIFILETPRSVIRLSTTPLSGSEINRVIANFPLWRNEGEDIVDTAEECLDLPPIVPFIPEGVPKSLEKSHEIVCKKLEQFRQIDTSSNDPILFETRGGRKKSRDRSRKTSTKNAPSVNLLQSTHTSQMESKEEVKNETQNILLEDQDSFKTLSTYMDVSFYSNMYDIFEICLKRNKLTN